MKNDEIKISYLNRKTQILNLEISNLKNLLAKKILFLIKKLSFLFDSHPQSLLEVQVFYLSKVSFIQASIKICWNLTFSTDYVLNWTFIIRKIVNRIKSIFLRHAYCLEIFSAPKHFSLPSWCWCKFLKWL